MKTWASESRDDVGDLGGHQVVVDGHDVPAGLEGGQIDLEDLDAVGQDEGDGVARPQPEGLQPVDDLVGPAEQLARLELGAVGTDEGEVPRLLLRHRPESEVGHCVSPSSWPAPDVVARRSGPAQEHRTGARLPTDARTCSRRRQAACLPRPARRRAEASASDVAGRGIGGSQRARSAGGCTVAGFLDGKAVVITGAGGGIGRAVRPGLRRRGRQGGGGRHRRRAGR